ncbi:MAG: hypothetical protein ACRD1H_14710, partial [Vicinamibacterales bacterium]
IAAHDEAERLAGIAGDQVLAAYVHYTRGSGRCLRADIRRGLRELEAGIAEIDTLLADHHLLPTEAQAMSVIRRLLPDGVDQITTTVDGSHFNLQRAILINWLGHSGHYREAIAIGDTFRTGVEETFGPDYYLRPLCSSGLHGIAHAQAALGRPDDARATLRLSRAAVTAQRDHAFVEVTHWSEQLMVLIPYLTDQLAERGRLIAEANRAWERCNGMTIVVAGDGAPSEVQNDLLEGRWQKAEQLATDHLTAPWVNLTQEAIAVLAILAHRQGQPEIAWQRVGQLLPEGPATEPGNAFFPHAITAIAVAVELALDAGDSATARRWIETHGRWLDWSGAKLWQADHQLLLARWHKRAGQRGHAVNHANAARELASDPR